MGSFVGIFDSRLALGLFDEDLDALKFAVIEPRPVASRTNIDCYAARGLEILLDQRGLTYNARKDLAPLELDDLDLVEVLGVLDFFLGELLFTADEDRLKLAPIEPSASAEGALVDDLPLVLHLVHPGTVFRALPLKCHHKGIIARSFRSRN